jgi:diguanylate cyclase (GGDEF)-like protein
LLAVATALALGQEPTTDREILALVMALLGGAAWYFPLQFGPRARIQLDTAVAIAAVLLFPPGVAALVTGLGPLLANARRREPWQQAGFNAAQYAFQALAGGVILDLLGWHVADPSFAWPQPLLPVLIAALVMHAVNTGAVAGMVALQDRRSFFRTWRMFALTSDRAELLAHLAQIGIGVLAAAVVTVEPWLLALLLVPGAAVYGALGHHTRLRVRAEARVVHQAFHDPLTDLPNRALLGDRLSAALSRVSEGSGAVSLLLLDLDRFKLINDTLGHQAGDTLLVTVAERLRASVRPGDTVARLGGDEFTVLLEHVTSPAQAEEVAARITSALALPIDLGGRTMVVTTSIGIAHHESGHASEADLLRDADVALYQAKAAGRACWAIYDAAAGAAAQERLALESDLRLALERDELRIVYQPAVRLATGRVVAVEAFLRWEHPLHGTLTPERFLPIAEETGLIRDLGRWALEEACREAARWQSAALQPPPVVSVNVAAAQLQDPEFVADVRRALTASGLPGTGLQLEIAEAVVMADAAGAIRTLEQLCPLGVRGTLDHFGTGPSSLTVLPRVPIEALHLDRSFVGDLDRRPEAATVAQAIIGLAHGLGLAVAAEGVESPAQLELLRSWGCDLAQGVYFASPMDGEALIESLNSAAMVMRVEARISDA